jgi:hypothetical protein
MSDKDLSVSIFKHSISPEFIEQLNQEAAKEGWWKDALADPKLFIALRGSSLNVYWRGQSLFLVTEGSSGLTVTTHEKYLVDPALASQVPLNDGAFDVASLVENGFIRHYKGPATLAKMKSAAGLFSGLEKTGCHEIAVRNPSVIDCEIAFARSMSPGDGGGKNAAPRVDLASLERDGNDVRLVFWEAKDLQMADSAEMTNSAQLENTRRSVTRSKYTRIICRKTANTSRKNTNVSPRTWWRSRKKWGGPVPCHR